MMKEETGNDDPTVGMIPQPSGADLPAYDKSPSTKRNCIIGICFSALLGIICLAACGPILSHSAKIDGVLRLLKGIRTVELPLVAARVLPLLVNIVIAGCTEVLGYVHATSLRWALIHEDRLQFNSNLRFFTTSTRTWANGKAVNFVSGTLLVICYTASGQMFPVLNWYHLPIPTVIVNGISLLMLGIGLLGLCAVAIFSLSAGKAVILTWSPNPLTNALACVHHGMLTHRPGRGMMPVHIASLPAQSREAVSRQRPVREAYKATSTVAKFMWVVFALSCLLAGTICGITFTKNRAPSLHFFAEGGQDATTDVGVGGPYWPASSLLFCGFLFGAFFQAIITLSLHCMELLVNVSRDEAVWRAAASGRAGARLRMSALAGATRSWEWWVLFALKPLAQWLLHSAGISYVVSYNVMMEFNPEPLFVLAGTTLILVLLGEFLVRSKPEGPQPAAYGHLQTLVDLVDDWGAGSEERLVWGAKESPSACGYGKVGTSSCQELVQAVTIGSVYS